MSQLLSAAPVVEKIQSEIRARVRSVISRLGRPPGLSVVLVGEDPASVIYTKKKKQVAESLGIASNLIALPRNSSPQEVLKVVEKLNQDPWVDGILIQRPLPAQSGFVEEEVLTWVTPEKDVDAFHPSNAGKLFLGLPAFHPCTPAGVMELLRHYGISPTGMTACVLGRSTIVGRPMAQLLLQADASVLQLHSKSKNAAELCRQADLVVVAIGKPGWVDERWIKPGAVVVDVGIHRNSEGKIVGDVDFSSVSRIASAITPVPGGVGPMTISVLMQNTLISAERKFPR